VFVLKQSSAPPNLSAAAAQKYVARRICMAPAARMAAARRRDITRCRTEFTIFCVDIILKGERLAQMIFSINTCCVKSDCVCELSIKLYNIKMRTTYFILPLAHYKQ
jgi:hypothetical protein